MPPRAPDAGVARSTTQDFHLRLAPEPSLIVTARLFASGLARLSGCGEELIEDVKLAVSEACAVALSVREALDSLVVDARRDGQRLTFEVGPAPADPSTVHDGQAAPLPGGLDLVRLVFDDARVTTSAGESMISFSVDLDRGSAR